MSNTTQSFRSTKDELQNDNNLTISSIKIKESSDTLIFMKDPKRFSYNNFNDEEIRNRLTNSKDIREYTKDKEYELNVRYSGHDTKETKDTKDTNKTKEISKFKETNDAEETFKIKELAYKSYNAKENANSVKGSVNSLDYDTIKKLEKEKQKDELKRLFKNSESAIMEENLFPYKNSKNAQYNTKNNVKYESNHTKNNSQYEVKRFVNRAEETDLRDSFKIFAKAKEKKHKTEYKPENEDESNAWDKFVNFFNFKCDSGACDTNFKR